MQTGKSTSWTFVLPMVVAMVIGLLAVFHETAWSMVSIWYRSETFAHGFIILPISLWLVWEKRKVLAGQVPDPENRVLVLILGAGGVWLIGNLASALVIQQLALVALIILSVWMMLGKNITRLVAFPLAFLFFSVPMGEDLVPSLMEITATFTVELIKLTGIPVYREGLHFSLPSGNWSVVEACSGVRYLIASVTLGCLYAYLTYKRLFKRVMFIFISAIVPIAANAVRAYIIVMLGHLSDMKIATGVDHLIYGWLFFGLVMMILFWIGSKWRDPTEQRDKEQSSNSVFSEKQVLSRKKILLSSFVAFGGILIWPMLAVAINSQAPLVPGVALDRPDRIEGWQESSEPSWEWSPMLLGADRRLDAFYENGSSRVMVSTGQYIIQEQGEEMINSQNLLVDPNLGGWRVVGVDSRTIQIGQERIPVDVTLVRGAGKRLLVWSWYRVGGLNTVNPYYVKLYEAFYKLTFRQKPSSLIIYSINAEEEGSPLPNRILESFVSKSYPMIKQSLDRVVN